MAGQNSFRIVSENGCPEQGYIYFYSVVKDLRYYILLHLIIFMWGFTGILGKLILLDPVYIVFFRVVIAFLSLLVGLRLLKMPQKIAGKKQAWKVIGVGCIVALHWLTFYTAIHLSTASLGILCLSTTTLHVTWLEPIVFRKRFSPVEFLFGLMVVFGIYFVSENFTPDQYLALGIGLFSALCSALFAVFNAKLSEDTPTSAITLYEMGTGVVVVGIVMLCAGKINSSMFRMRGEDLGWLLFLGIACTSFAFLATLEVVKKLGAFTVSLSINLEPVYTILLAIPILHEDKMLSGNFYIGAVLIIAIVVLNAVYKSYISRRKKAETL